MQLLSSSFKEINLHLKHLFIWRKYAYLNEINLWD